MATATIPFDVLNRWTRQVQFTAQIACSVDALPSVKLGLAVKWAVREKVNLVRANLYGANLVRANLDGANLYGANLDGANLYGANLVRANLVRANLVRANLDGANLDGANLDGANLDGANLPQSALRPFKADLWLILAGLQGEVAGIVQAIREGRIDGSCYDLRNGCACLMGTAAAIRGAPVSAMDTDSSRPAERWFMMIRPGDKPGDESGGGFASKIALDWALEFCRTFGIDPDAPPAPAKTEAA